MKEYIVSGDILVGIEDSISERELVRCKDCTHGLIVNGGFMVVCNQRRQYIHERDWFCADGERKKDG